MASVSSKIHIGAPKDQVWEVLSDLGGIYKWNPGVSSSHYTSEQTQGDGATRHCDLESPRGYLEERALEWRDGEGYVIDVYDSNLPIEKNRIEFSLTAEGDGATVTVTPDYKLKYGLLGSLLDRLWARRQLQKGFDEMLAGLKHHVETGELVGDKVPARAGA